ncbi:MAG: hypothetical protein RDV48_30775 [Candidatus Eremiobacteraeota bacterium]|nr:hypothetical protein [Candidatus Eremiobacteraeota bacterium]
MPKVKRWFLSVILTAAAFLALSGDVSGTIGIVLTFDEAVAKAKLIVIGKITKGWEPKVHGLNNSKLSLQTGRVYRMKVEKVYKGSIRPGDEVVFWEQYYGTTASLFIDEGKRSLVFLMPANLDEFQSRRFDFGVEKPWQIFGNISDDSPSGYDGFAGYPYLLENFVLKKPVKLKPALAQILREKEEPCVLEYAISHWPREMTAEDRRFFNEQILRHSGDMYIT